MEAIQEVAKRFSLEKGLTDNLVGSQPTRELFLKVIADSQLKEAPKKIGNMLYSVTTKVPIIIEQYRKLLAQLVGQGLIDNATQLEFAIANLKDQQVKGGVDVALFRKVCRIDDKPTIAEIQAIIQAEIKGAVDSSVMFQCLANIKSKLPFVDGKAIKDSFDQIWKAAGIPEKPKEPKKAEEQKPKPNELKKDEEAHPEGQNEEGLVRITGKSLFELIGREMKAAVNTKAELQWREQNFGTRPLTRFPPEPNGYLHIGHCKAMRFNFQQASVAGGDCYLRFDDTNPLKENIEYIENIKENIGWMGYKPWKITHASDNFDFLYEAALRLIKQGDAFICSENKEETAKNRDLGVPSKDRDRPIAENLRLFKRMRLGLYEEGQYCLRAKIDYKHPNTTLRDPAIYRIRFTSHPHCGNKWCIYPLYDFTHSICDSLEGISYSLCSLEFEVRRELYYWSLNRLGMYKPNVWQYSRLNITYTVMSKRKLHQLIFDNKVNGWDDPRVLTINGMRRRGYPAEAINNFCDEIGVTRRGNQNYIQFGLLQNEVKKYLDVHAPRTMAVLEPVVLTIVNLQAPQTILVPLFPKDKTGGERPITLTKQIYVQLSDIRLVDSPKFYGIAVNKIVGLKYALTILIKQIRVENGKPVEVIAELAKEDEKPKSYLHWISVDECFSCQARMYSTLFTQPKAGELPNYADFLNNQLEIHRNVKCHNDLKGKLKLYDKHQFQRRGFFCTDKDSNFEANKIVWNLTVELADKKKTTK